LPLTSFLTDLIYKCGGIDKRTIEKFEKVRGSFLRSRNNQYTKTYTFAHNSPNLQTHRCNPRHIFCYHEGQILVGCGSTLALVPKRTHSTTVYISNLVHEYHIQQCTSHSNLTTFTHGT
jgi:hypothetical protein